MDDKRLEMARSIVADALDLELSRVDDNASIDSIAEWDSIAHMRMIMSLERMNGKPLDSETLITISSLADVAKALNPDSEKQ